MPKYSQQDRQMAIATPLGRDALLLQGVSAHEAVSQPFRIEADLLSTNPAIDFEQVIGKRATIAMHTPAGPRYFDGIVKRFAQTAGGATELSSYSAEIVPWTWLLTLTADCRIFQQLTVPDILEQILVGGDVQFDLRATYPVREYCVQYRETDFNFASRLMEQYGIYYYYRHENGKHTMVLADSPDAHPACPGQPRARYQRTQGTGAALEADVVGGWARAIEMRPGKYTLTDYNFETPGVSLRVGVKGIHPPSTGQRYEIYDYPGEYSKKDEGEQLVRLRIEEEEALRQTAHARSGCRNFTAGHRFDLTEHERASENRGHVLLAVDHEAAENGYLSDEGAFEYANTFSCIPTGIPYRPSRSTVRPSIQGCQTAEVVGPSGEEIYCDNYGRVKVQFHWDREGRKNEHSSCWIRVSHPWAGKGWGAISIPRIGQEVIVDFLEGDPDQPIVTGRVYNGAVMPPYDLPGEMTRSGIKSNTHKGGGYNEITMDDTAGHEQMRIHAQYDMNSVVGNDQTLQVGHDQTAAIANDRTLQVGHNDTTIVAIDRTTSVGNNVVESCANDHTTMAGQNLVIMAGTSITLKCGASVIKMNQAGVITIAGTIINVAGSINTNVTAPITTISALALLSGAAAVNLSAGGVVNRIEGGTTVVNGGKVLINC